MAPSVMGAHEMSIKPPPVKNRNPSGLEIMSPTTPTQQSTTAHKRASTLSVQSSLPKTPTTPKTPTDLTSSRPAPPSPASSRRTSTRSSIPNSSALSRASSTRNKRQSQLSISHLAPPQEPVYVRVVIKIRDFAFPPSDDRYRGLGEHVPKPCKPSRLNRKLGALPDADGEDDDSDDDAENEDGEDAWTGFKWGAGRFSWSFSPSSSSSSNNAASRHQSEGGFPTKNDLDLNFTNASPPDEEDEDGYDSAEEGEEGGQQGELHPGIYRAVYAFDGEGDSEMSLEEGQLVKVIGRGGGVGWAVAVREGVDSNAHGGSNHALVPESYLEVVQLDGEDEDDD